MLVRRLFVPYSTLVRRLFDRGIFVKITSGLFPGGRGGIIGSIIPSVDIKRVHVHLCVRYASGIRPACVVYKAYPFPKTVQPLILLFFHRDLFSLT